MSRAGYVIAHRLTQAEIDAGLGNNLTGGLIEIIDSSGAPTGTIYMANGGGSIPSPISGGFPEAPIDGMPYARQSASWVQIAPSNAAKQTRIVILHAYAAQATLNVNVGDGNHSVTGDHLSLGNNSTSFNSSTGIIVELNGVKQGKSFDVIWLSTVTLKFTIALDPDDVITIQA
jgi:hypothetical protein